MAAGLSFSLFSFMKSSECRIFELSELEKWYNDFSSLNKKEVTLKDILDQLTKEGKIKSRQIESRDQKSCDIYWLPPSENMKSDNISHSSFPVRPSPHKRKSLHSPVDVPKKKLKTCRPAHASITTGCHGNDDDVEIRTLRKENKDLLEQLRDKEKRLQKLRLVKLYRTKNDLSQLNGLIQKWRSASQEAAETLLELSPANPRPSMSDLLNFLHIDYKTIQYSIEDESFY